VKDKCLYGVLLLIVVGSTGMFAQDCPKWGNKAAALKFLQENRPHSTAADPACVNRAFSTLSHDKSYADALVALLDFERSIENDDSLKTRSSQYPAIGALMDIGVPAVPLLIKAIKENDNELVRTNAAHALGAIHRPCVRSLLAKLEAEASKPETTGEQQGRLRAAKDYIGTFYPQCKSETQ
jgi:hypothetical protein